MRDQAGIARWPAVPVEMFFNLAAIVVFSIMCRKKQFVGQHFHLYLMVYGAFRFFHEFLRETPRLTGAFSGYQLAALAVMALGVVGFIHRRTQFAGNSAPLNVPQLKP
jgi:phosphatidylglycerol:prolipoprotein diacylglycerol transferase